MEKIRPLIKSDISSVAQLFQTVFRHSTKPSPASLTSYFEEIYLNNPWRDGSVNSLVYERDGKIDGFLGAIPLPMMLNGKPILAVVGGNYMINTERPNPLAGVKILKTLFSGPQAVTYTDTATGTARKIWEGLGSTAIQLQSMQWFRVFRPVEFAAYMGDKNRSLSILMQIARPFSHLLDGVLSNIPQNPFRVTVLTHQVTTLTSSELFHAIQNFSSPLTFKPAYNETSFAWLLNKSEEKQEFGPLKKIGVFNSQGTLQGWFLYYPNKGKLGHVLQIGAYARTINVVLSCLLSHAQQEGSLAIAGRVEPRFIPEFSSQNCIFTHRNASLVVYTQNKEILNALHSGDAFFTRLEGEWWTRLQGDSFM